MPPFWSEKSATIRLLLSSKLIRHGDDPSLPVTVQPGGVVAKLTSSGLSWAAKLFAKSTLTRSAESE